MFEFCFIIERGLEKTKISDISKNDFTIQILLVLHPDYSQI